MSLGALAAAAVNESIAAPNSSLTVAESVMSTRVECVVVVLGGLGELAELVALRRRGGSTIAAAACGEGESE